jgi:hypothetical protein
MEDINMKNKFVQEKCAKIKKCANILSKSATSWDAAITDAKSMIKESESRIIDLKLSIKIFERLRDKGEPFPGEGAKRDTSKGDYI